MIENLESDFSKIAALIGDKVRAKMLWNLLDGKAYTATELANFGEVSLQSASNHLSKMLEGELLQVEKQGRHRYYRLKNEQVAKAVESIASLIPEIKSIQRISQPEVNAFTYARTCYDHLAGKLAVTITRSLIEQEIIKEEKDSFLLLPKGEKWFAELGIDIEKERTKKRLFATKCLDFSERKHHLGGALGAAFLSVMFENDWLRKTSETRTLILTSKGKKKLEHDLKIEF